MIKKILLIVTMLTLLPSLVFSDDWKDLYRETLQEGKIKIAEAMNAEAGTGLAYTMAEAEVLKLAVKRAVEDKGYPCTILTIGVEEEYNAYDLLRLIYGYGENLEIDELCMCATGAGVTKAVIASAVRDAKDLLGNPIYDLDEIAEAQCFKDVGLPYTMMDEPLEIITPISIPPENPISRYTP